MLPTYERQATEANTRGEINRHKPRTTTTSTTTRTITMMDDKARASVPFECTICTKLGAQVEQQQASTKKNLTRAQSAKWQIEFTRVSCPVSHSQPVSVRLAGLALCLQPASRLCVLKPNFPSLGKRQRYRVLLRLATSPSRVHMLSLQSVHSNLLDALHE